VVLGEAMNTVIVTSSKLVMKASTQPLASPGRIIGKVTRRNVRQAEAPSEIAACSISRSRPVAAVSTRRSANGITMTT